MRSTKMVSASLLGASLLFLSSGPAFGHDTDDTPTVHTQSAIELTLTGAKLRGHLKTGDDDARYRFQHGPTTSYGTNTPWQDLEEAISTYQVSRSISDLAPSTTYNFRLMASDDDGENVVHGVNRSFVTLAPPAPGVSFPLGYQAPQLGSSVGLAETSGAVKVKRPGKGKFKPLAAESVVPVGSVVDASQGSIALTSELPSGKTQTGEFRGGEFVVRQGRGGYVDLYLRGRGPVCKRARKGSAMAAGRRKPRRLFGSDKGGRFRTHGRNSHATVRGTRWMVEDRCDGTLTRVSEGAVVVRDRIKKKNVLVKAGGRYLARPKR